MKQYISILKATKLFQSMPEDKIMILLSKLQARVQLYKKNQSIIASNEAFSYVCILVEGTAHIMKEQMPGTVLLLSELEPGDMFAESYVFAQVSHLPVSVVAMSDCKVLLLDFQHFTGTGDELTVWILNQMLTIIASKNVAMNERMELLSQRTMREKVLLYLKRLAIKRESNTVSIPFNRLELADYLCVDRSALSRELSHLQREGMIRYAGRVFTLLINDHK